MNVQGNPFAVDCRIHEALFFGALPAVNAAEMAQRSLIVIRGLHANLFVRRPYLLYKCNAVETASTVYLYLYHRVLRASTTAVCAACFFLHMHTMNVSDVLDIPTVWALPSALLLSSKLWWTRKYTFLTKIAVCVCM